MGPTAEILREGGEGKHEGDVRLSGVPGEGAADCSVSALHLLETFLASVKKKSNLISTSLRGLFTGA